MSETLPFSRGRPPRGTYAAALRMSWGVGSVSGFFCREILSAARGAILTLLAGCLRSAMLLYWLGGNRKQQWGEGEGGTVSPRDAFRQEASGGGA